MSKFDAILKRIGEQTGTAAVTPQQQNTAAGIPPKPAAGQPTQPQAPQPQAIQQAAKILGMDPKALEQMVLASQQQTQQKAPANNQPAV